MEVMVIVNVEVMKNNNICPNIVAALVYDAKPVHLLSTIYVLMFCERISLEGSTTRQKGSMRCDSKEYTLLTCETEGWER